MSSGGAATCSRRTVAPAGRARSATRGRMPSCSVVSSSGTRIRLAMAVLLLDDELQHTGREGVPHLRVVEDGHTEGIRLVFAELHVVLAVRDELAPEDERPQTVLPRRPDRDVGAVTREGSHDDAGHLVAGLVPGVVERLLLGVDDPVGRGGLVALEGELRRGLVVAHVVDVAAGRLGIALAPGLRRLVLVVPRGVQV